MATLCSVSNVPIMIVKKARDKKFNMRLINAKFVCIWFLRQRHQMDLLSSTSGMTAQSLVSFTISETLSILKSTKFPSILCQCDKDVKKTHTLNLECNGEVLTRSFFQNSSNVSRGLPSWTQVYLNGVG